MFGMIAVVGLLNLQLVVLNSVRNLFILGFAFFMGLSLPEYFATYPHVFDEAWMSGLTSESYKSTMGAIDNMLVTLGSTGMAVGAFIAQILDNTIPGTREERGLQHMVSSSESS